MLLTYKENVHSTQMYIPLKPLFSRHKGIGVQFTDEPTGNLDSHTSEEVMELMRQVVKKQGKTLVMVTHDDHLAAYADRIFHIIDGKIVKVEVNAAKEVKKESGTKKEQSKETKKEQSKEIKKDREGEEE